MLFTPRQRRQGIPPGFQGVIGFLQSNIFGSGGIGFGEDFKDFNGQRSFLFAQQAVTQEGLRITSFLHDVDDHLEIPELHPDDSGVIRFDDDAIAEVTADAGQRQCKQYIPLAIESSVAFKKLAQVVPYSYSCPP